ncbi:MAG: hypothetical protein M0R21_01880 [Lentimicrobiaceae bacterium]|jgi:hypothetical protein|nr:hypothetical protein [Lentimicrobiaceae bacterium]
MKFRIAGFALISIFLITSCIPAAYRHLSRETIPKTQRTEFPVIFPDTFTKAVYRTSLSFFGNSLSGISFIKKMPDSSYRVVFTNEMGIKFFDLAFCGKNFKVMYCMPKLNRKIVIKLLRNDLQMLFTDKFEGEKAEKYADSVYRFRYKSNKNYYHLIGDEHQPTKIIFARNAKVKVKTTILYHDNFPEMFIFEHQQMKISIKFQKMEL